MKLGTIERLIVGMCAACNYSFSVADCSDEDAVKAAEHCGFARRDDGLWYCSPCSLNDYQRADRLIGRNNHDRT